MNFLHRRIEPLHPSPLVRWSFVGGLTLFGAIMGIAIVGLPGWERQLFYVINASPNGWNDAMLLLSALWTPIVAVPASVVIAALWRRRQLAWQLAVMLVTANAVVSLLKVVVDRGRPLELLHDTMLRVPELGAGFPSAHTVTVTIIMLLVLPLSPRAWRWWVPCVVIASVGFSRMYLGQHFPLDVVGGFALGVVMVTGMRLLPLSMQQRLHLSSRQHQRVNVRR